MAKAKAQPKAPKEPAVNPAIDPELTAGERLAALKKQQQESQKRNG